ncbi:tRNA synthetases class II family protein [Mycobacterium xenopi 3993]|nr:tRNA synthetases class II family protein [Mycobacterium xenopi 3993]
MRYRVIADHSRTAAILIGDGVSPAMTGAATCCAGCCAG